MNREQILRRRIKWMVWLFIGGLVFSGITAIPLEWELELITRILSINHLEPSQAPNGWSKWFLLVREALVDTNNRYPFIAYGFDWLAFGHIVIAISFIGLLRDPVRNIWLFDFALIACVLVIPWAFVFGHLRGIPVPWRLIDCAFGFVGIVPVYVGKKWTRELAGLLTEVR